MRYLLDTNVCIRYLNGRSPEIREALRQHKPEEIVVCSVVKAELYYGAHRSHNPQRSLEKQGDFLSQFVSLPFDDNAAEKYGEIRADLAGAGQIIGPNDLLITAIAVANEVTLVTHNTREFSRVKGLMLEDWEAS